MEDHCDVAGRGDLSVTNTSANTLVQSAAAVAAQVQIGRMWRRQSAIAGH